MFRPREIFKLEEENRKKYSIENKKRSDCAAYSMLWGRMKMNRLRDLQYKIIKSIEENSGWQYVASSFEYRKDFYYDYESMDIKFDISRVECINGSYTYNEDYGKRFCEKYGDLLVRLAAVEKKMDDVYESNKERVDKNVAIANAMEQERLENLKKRREELLKKREEERKRQIENGTISFSEESLRIARENNADISFEDTKGADFFEKYGMKGVLQLVELLNTASKEMDPMPVYNILRMQSRTNIRRADYIEWLATYLTNGQVLLEEFNKERERGMVRMESPVEVPDAATVRDAIMIKFHM